MRIVILGGTGLIGHKLFQKLSQRFENVYAVIHRSKAEFKQYEIFSSPNVIENMDVSDFKALDGLLRALQPDLIINCIGVTKRHPEANAPKLCITLNSLLPHVLAEWGVRHNSRVMVFSTDCIFDGKRGGYIEESLPSAEDLYGRTKFLGEVYGSNCLTLRTSFIGRELSSFTELLEWFIAQNGKTVRGFTNALYTGISTLFLSEVVSNIIERHQGLSGLYHLSGDAISKYDLLCLARDAFKLDVEVVPEGGFTCHRTLIGKRFRDATGIMIPSWQEMMLHLAEDKELYDRRNNVI